MTVDRAFDLTERLAAIDPEPVWSVYPYNSPYSLSIVRAVWRKSGASRRVYTNTLLKTDHVCIPWVVAHDARRAMLRRSGLSDDAASDLARKWYRDRHGERHWTEVWR